MKKAISFILSVMIILCIIPAVSSDADVDISAEYSLDNADIMVISGTESNAQAGTEITVTVFYEGKNYDGLSDGLAGQIAAVLTAYTDTDGKWRADFVPAESAYYDIYAGAGYRDYAVKPHVYAMKDRSNVIDTIINSDKSSVEEVFADEATLRGVVTDVSKTESVTDTSYIGTILYGIREKITDKTEILKYLDAACAMAVMHSVKTAQSLDTVISELEKTGYSIDNLNIYEENATDNIKTAIAKRMANCVDGGLDSFNSSFTDALVLGGVEASEAWIDIAPFMELLNNQIYTSNVYKVSTAVVKKSYSTIAELNEAISDAVSSGSGGGMGGGGGAVSGSGSGVANGIFGAVSGNTADTDIKTGERQLMRDVDESHWAFDSIHHLYWKDIVSGDDKGYFYPDNNITRAEMLKILCRAFDITEVNKASFDDVSSSDWYYGYAGAAKSAGLAEGYEGKLNPGGYLTREDMAVLVYRFALYKGMEFESAAADFADSAYISDYATEAVGALSKSGVINGIGNKMFAPGANSTRAEVSAMIYRLITE